MFLHFKEIPIGLCGPFPLYNDPILSSDIGKLFCGIMRAVQIVHYKSNLWRLPVSFTTPHLNKHNEYTSSPAMLMLKCTDNLRESNFRFTLHNI